MNEKARLTHKIQTVDGRHDLWQHRQSKVLHKIIDDKYPQKVKRADKAGDKQVGVRNDCH